MALNGKQVNFDNLRCYCATRGGNKSEQTNDGRLDLLADVWRFRVAGPAARYTAMWGGMPERTAKYNSRKYANRDPLGLILSIVGTGRLDIDRFADHTIDKALFEGHVLCRQGSRALVSGPSRGGWYRACHHSEGRRRRV